MVQSVHLYGADALDKKMDYKWCPRCTDRLKLASAYHTVSKPAALVITGVNPIDLLSVYLRKTEVSKEITNQEGIFCALNRW